MNKKQIENWIIERPSYLKESVITTRDAIKKSTGCTVDHNLIKEIQKNIKVKLESLKNIEKGNKSEIRNIGVVGDLHAPFTRTGYLEFCKETFIKYNVTDIVFIGDIVDNHFSSFHETIPDGLSAGDELDYAINEIQKWYKEFPTAKVCIGNHDALVQRKAVTAGLSKRWLKSYNEVLGCPNWNFDMEHEIDGVIYYHGTGSSGDRAALTRALNMRKPVVQGHIHTVAGVQFNASAVDLLWGLQVGCGIDDKSYAMAYAQHNIRKSIIGCGLVLNNGTLPFFVPMTL